MTFWPWLQTSRKPVQGGQIWWLSSLGSRSRQNQPHEAWFDGFLALDPEVDKTIVFMHFEWSRIYFLGDVQNSPGEWKVLVLLNKIIVFLYLRQEPPRATMDAQRGSRSQQDLPGASMACDNWCSRASQMNNSWKYAILQFVWQSWNAIWLAREHHLRK